MPLMDDVFNDAQRWRALRKAVAARDMTFISVMEKLAPAHTPEQTTEQDIDHACDVARGVKPE